MEEGTGMIVSTRGKRVKRRRYKGKRHADTVVFLVILLLLGSAVAVGAVSLHNRAEAPSNDGGVTTLETPQTLTAPTEQPSVPTPKPTPTPTPTPEPTPTLVSLGKFHATAYCGCVKCCGIWSQEHPSRVGTDYVQKTASGTIPVAGVTVAADWSILPCGTVIVVNGHEYTVEDSGGLVKGKTIDIYMESHEEALQFGVQEIEVFVYEEAGFS
jgi:3D (Asp-Asp-Asp) domain-containing protein